MRLVGALLAVPFAAVVQVFIVRVLTPWICGAISGVQPEAEPEPVESHNDSKVGCGAKSRVVISAPFEEESSVVLPCASQRAVYHIRPGNQVNPS